MDAWTHADSLSRIDVAAYHAWKAAERRARRGQATAEEVAAYESAYRAADRATVAACLAALAVRS